MLLIVNEYDEIFSLEFINFLDLINKFKKR